MPRDFLLGIDRIDGPHFDVRAHPAWGLGNGSVVLAIFYFYFDVGSSWCFICFLQGFCILSELKGISGLHRRQSSRKEACAREIERGMRELGRYDPISLVNGAFGATEQSLLGEKCDVNLSEKGRAMVTNIHPIERVLRVAVGLGLLSQVFFGLQSAWFYLGLIPMLTGIVGWCPPYALLGINTCEWRKKSLS